MLKAKGILVFDAKGSNGFAIHKKKLYEEVMEQISLLIEGEAYKAGDRLPSLKELSQMFQVGQPTVCEANYYFTLFSWCI